jgi:RHS repeat-associated protein
MFKPDFTVFPVPAPGTNIGTTYINKKQYELTNHLGNVLAVVTDNRTAVDSDGNGQPNYYEAVVAEAREYYPFGMVMPNRKTPAAGNSAYRFGFNGKENDDEAYGDDNQQDYGMRVYDPRLGRFLSVDPIAAEYPELTSYQFASNTPIQAIDLDGLEKFVISLQRTTNVNNTKIDVKKAEFIIYKASLTIEYPDGSIEYLRPESALVIYENKSQQEGKNKANAVVVGDTYDLEWIDMKHIDPKLDEIHIERKGKGHSDRTYIHPLGTTAPSENGGGFYTLGCKGIACEEDISISEDGENVYAGAPYIYKRDGRGEVTYPTKEDRKKDYKAWDNSRKAMQYLRDVWEKHKDKLQKDDNFELRVEPPLIEESKNNASENEKKN